MTALHLNAASASQSAVEVDAAASTPTALACYQLLLSQCRQGADWSPDNIHYLAQMLSSQVVGKGAIGSCLGLSRIDYQHLLKACFADVPDAVSEVITDGIDPVRFDERDELIALLMTHQNKDLTERQCRLMAEIIAAGCLGSDHLWQDLGLWQRSELTAMIRHNFPTLAAKNDRNMKWKKFFYKQLCALEGIYICRSPSCEVCEDFKVCFAPED